MDSKGRYIQVGFFVTFLAFIFVTFSTLDTVSAKDAGNGCIDCHSKPAFRVINKKLYKYFREWELSIHGVQGVSCVDCHGGNPIMTDKKKAHGKDIKELLTPVEYERILLTCGKCHAENAENYKQSEHYRILLGKGRLYPSPNCITCHGSINTLIPKSDAIADICAHCHNAITENHPEIPEIASYLVSRLSFINSYYRYLVSKGVVQKSPDFLPAIDRELSELAQIWHTLNLERIEEKTIHVRTLMMKKGKELRQGE